MHLSLADRLSLLDRTVGAIAARFETLPYRDRLAAMARHPASRGAARDGTVVEVRG